MNLTESQQPMFEVLEKNQPYCYKAPDKCSSHDLLPLKDIQQPRDSDVLYGIGGITINHPGNKFFRRLIEELRQEYISAETHHDKYMICMKVVNEIRSSNPPGRFLMKDPSTKRWYDVGDKCVMFKVCRAFKEKAKKQKMLLTNKIHTSPLQEKQAHCILAGNENKYHGNRAVHERTETTEEISSRPSDEVKRQRIDQASCESSDEHNSVNGADVNSQLKETTKSAKYDDRNIQVSFISYFKDHSSNISSPAIDDRDIISNTCHSAARKQYPICDQSSLGDESDLSVLNNDRLTSRDGVVGISDASVKTFPIGASISINFTSKVFSNDIHDEYDSSIATFSLTASLTSNCLNRTLNNSSYDHSDVFSNSITNSPPQEILIPPLSLQRDASEICIDEY